MTAKIAGLKPIVMELEPGDYFWCSCGQAINQPFCDGSHKTADPGENFTPLKFSLSEKKKVALCTCKATATPPFCDGGHKKLTPT